MGHLNKKGKAAMITGILLFTACMMTVNIRADAIEDVFKNKGAEITSYRLSQPRYGEPRQGYSVMIFVPEDISLTTRIKVEDYGKVAAADRVRVLKLNRVLEFNTGIYNYSVMTTVQSATGQVFNREPFYPLKISITVSEWCGNFYAHLLPDGRSARRTMHSYFQAEGDRQDLIPEPGNAYYEDDLPILIRELNGPFLKRGERRECNILPALWHSRMTHHPLAYEPGSIQKEGVTVVGTAEGEIKAVKWTWQVGERQESWWVEEKYPHVILKWQGSEGETGERIKTIYSRYWEKHSNQDTALRRELGLP